MGLGIPLTNYVRLSAMGKEYISLAQRAGNLPLRRLAVCASIVRNLSVLKLISILLYIVLPLAIQKPNSELRHKKLVLYHRLVYYQLQQWRYNMGWVDRSHSKADRIVEDPTDYSPKFFFDADPNCKPNLEFHDFRRRGQTQF